MWFVLVLSIILHFKVIPADGLTLNNSCLSGSVPLVIADSCGEGFYCPYFNASDLSTRPVLCVPTNECLLKRLTFSFCSAQGTFEPIPCPEGFYCPEVNKKVDCPENYFCPIGQMSPLPCSSMSFCPKNSSIKLEYGAIIITLIIDVSASLIIFLLIKLKNKIIKNRNVELENNKKSKKKILEDLNQGFTKAQNNHLTNLFIQFNDLAIHINNIKDKHGNLVKKNILNGVNGTLQPGKVTAIMGPSGAGKTSLLYCLLDRIDPAWARSGSLLINGKNDLLSKYKHVTGYVPQDDIMHRDLSIYDNIKYSAFTRLPRDWTHEQVNNHVNSVISILQLTESQDIIIGDESKRGVSGGQRKRCNMGIELAAAPLLLLLDEPTSGLDSTSALEICQVLTDLARSASITVAMVIHQPRIEIFNALDELLLLAPGGYTVYQGPQRLVMQYFKDNLNIDILNNISFGENPADVLMDLIASQAQQCIQVWKQIGYKYIQSLLATNVNNNIDIPINKDIEEQLTHQKVDSVDINNTTNNNNSNTNNNNNSNNSNTCFYRVAPAPIIITHSNPSEVQEKKENSLQGTTGIDLIKDNINVIEEHNNDNDELAVKLHIDNIPDKLQFSPIIKEQNDANKLINHNKVQDKSSHHSSIIYRSPSSFYSQTVYAFIRSVYKQIANPGTLVLEIGLGMLAGLLMGISITFKYQGILSSPYTLLSPAPLEGLVSQLMFNVGLAVSLASATAGCNVFGEERSIYVRELLAGHNPAAYYIGVTLAQFPRLLLDSIHFSCLFHIFSKPLTSYNELLPIIFLIYCGTYGLSALVSMILPRSSAPLLAVVLSLFFSSLTGGGNIPLVIQYFSTSFWGAEAIFTVETAPFVHLMEVESISASNAGFVLNRYNMDLFYMFLVMILYRIIAFIAMRWMDSKAFK